MSTLSRVSEGHNKKYTVLFGRDRTDPAWAFDVGHRTRCEWLQWDDDWL